MRALLLLCWPALAIADDAAIVTHPIALAPEQIGADLGLVVRLDRNYELETMSLAPDLWLGVGRGVTVGITHSDWSVDRIASGSSICIHRTIYDAREPCDRAYHNVNLDVRWATKLGSLDVAPRMRVMLRDVDPHKPAMTLGALGRWSRGAFSITADPYLRVGLANTALGNRTFINLPVFAALEVGSRVLLALHTGFDGDLAVITDGFHIPIGAIVRARISRSIELQLEAGFPSLIGPQNTTSLRTITAMLSFRS